MQLLFAVARSDNQQVEATYLDDAGETQSKIVEYGTAATALQGFVQAAVGGGALRGVQIFTEHSNTETGETKVEALFASPLEGGVSSTLVSTVDAADASDTDKAGNAALRGAVSALRSAVEAAL